MRRLTGSGLRRVGPTSGKKSGKYIYEAQVGDEGGQLLAHDRSTNRRLWCVSL